MVGFGCVLSHPSSAPALAKGKPSSVSSATVTWLRFPSNLRMEEYSVPNFPNLVSGVLQHGEGKADLVPWE
jgi:hypothetical protein